MNTGEIQVLYDYNFWADDRILKPAGELNQDQLVEPVGLSFGSLRGTLVHLVGTEWLWRKRIVEGISPPRQFPEADLPTLAQIVAFWQEQEALWRAYLAGLTDEEIYRVIRYQNTKGKPFENPVWELLLHLANHGTQTRSEAAVALTGFGHSPGDLDFILYLREKR